MINSNCQVKIIDFGLARKSLEEIALGTALEQPAEGSESWLKLTPYVMVRNYRAPEIFFKLKYDEEGWLIIF
jgi:serine/threonine protein kinase